jgi:hypothetical protein
MAVTHQARTHHQLHAPHALARAGEVCSGPAKGGRFALAKGWVQPAAHRRLRPSNGRLGSGPWTQNLRLPANVSRL